MTILVDAAVWRWRGQRWAHLVSDDSHNELHDFATAIGKKRVSFQGDHYDVNANDRIVAIEAGAKPVDSRELVRALRRSGLRRTRSGPATHWRWDLRGSIPTMSDLAPLLRGFRDEPAGASAFKAIGEVAEIAGLHVGPIEVMALKGATMQAALVVSAHVDLWPRHPDIAGLDVHEAYVSRSAEMLTIEVLTIAGTEP